MRAEREGEGEKRGNGYVAVDTTVKNVTLHVLLVLRQIHAQTQRQQSVSQSVLIVYVCEGKNERTSFAMYVVCFAFLLSVALLPCCIVK